MVSIISHVNQQRRQEGSCEPHWLTLTLQQTLISVLSLLALKCRFVVGTRGWETL